MIIWLIDIIDHNENEIFTSKDKLENIVYRTLGFVADLSQTNSVKIESSVDIEGKLKISFSTDSLNIPTEELQNIKEPFENKEFSKNQSGLVLALISKEVELLNGSFKVVENSGEFRINIALNVKTNFEASLETVLSTVK